MATVMEVISTLQGRGIALESDGSGGLRVNGISRLSERERAALKAHKASILKALSAKPALPTDSTSNEPVAPSVAVTEPLQNRTEPPAPGTATPFNKEALDAIKAGSGCWVWSGVLHEWLFWVQDAERKSKAIGKGIDPGCIWTLEELSGVQGMPLEGLRDIAQIKRKLDGTVQPGAKPARWGDALKPMEPEVAP